MGTVPDPDPKQVTPEKRNETRIRDKSPGKEHQNARKKTESKTRRVETCLYHCPIACAPKGL